MCESVNHICTSEGMKRVEDENGLDLVENGVYVVRVYIRRHFPDACNNLQFPYYSNQ